MKPSSKQLDILRATAAFATVERYQGTLPKRQALLFSKDDLAELEDAGFLERVKLSFPCGKTMAGWRLTATGRQALPGQKTIEDGELAPEHLRILNDVYHYSRITSHRGMMPKELAKLFDDDDMSDLFTHGYLLRIRIKSMGKSKGWVVSKKGLTALRLAAGTSSACSIAPNEP